MQTRDRFPVDAVTGGDFVTGRYQLAPGERVVDLDVDLDALPAWGRLCVHQQTVELMMVALGWTHDENLTAKNRALQAEVTRLRKVNKQMRNAVLAVIDAANEAGLTVAIDEDAAVPA